MCYVLILKFNESFLIKRLVFGHWSRMVNNRTFMQSQIMLDIWTLNMYFSAKNVNIRIVFMKSLHNCVKIIVYPCYVLHDSDFSLTYNHWRKFSSQAWWNQTQHSWDIWHKLAYRIFSAKHLNSIFRHASIWCNYDQNKSLHHDQIIRN